MYRTLNLFLAVVAIFVTAHLSAQTNSVSLKDGTGNVISQHNSITAAYAAIPATLTQAYLIEIDTTYKSSNETYPITFINKAGASSTNTITITTTVAGRNQSMVVAKNSIFVFDNADWIILDGKQIDYVGLRYSHSVAMEPSIQFINGASNNIIRGLIIQAYATIPAILFGTAPSATSGNSGNIIENCGISGYAKAIVSEGSLNNPNRNLFIKRNLFGLITNHAIKLSTGTGRTVIDSNEIKFRNDTNFSAGIITEVFNDSLFVTRNIIYLPSYSPQIAKLNPAGRGMYFESGGVGGYYLIANNFMIRNKYVYPSFDSTGEGIDNLTDVAGIEFGGNNKINADIYHNTILIRGVFNASLAAPGNIGSAAFIRSENNPNSIYNIKNNLFLNTRTGGIAGTKHIAIRLSNISGLNIDYNTYSSSHGAFARLGNMDYPALSGYKTAFAGGNEAHADSMNVNFISENGLHLASNMYGNIRMQGTAIPSITFDFENQNRTHPYRGADEFVISCGSITPGTISLVPYIGCNNSTTRLQLYGHTEANGMDYQWQYRLVGTTAFIDIPNAKTTHLIVRFSDSTEYRVKDSCISGAPAVYSATLTVASSTPYADSIIAIRNGGTYTFYLADTRNVTTVIWDLGNGITRTGDTITYNYNQTGSYIVKAQMRSSFCADTIEKAINVDLSVSDISSTSSLVIHPNPAKSLIGVQVHEQIAYTITDITGRLIQTGETKAGSIKISHLTPGNYILNITDNKGTKQYGRFVKE